jgi:hypothetical protein
MSLYVLPLRRWTMHFPDAIKGRQETMYHMLRRRFLQGIIGSTLLSLSGCGFFHRSDAELIAWFNQHESEFMRLVKMEQVAPSFCRDLAGHSYIYPKSPNGFSLDRWESYRDLFRVLRLEAGVFIQGQDSQWIPNSIMLTAEASGLSVNGSAKGYVWSVQTVPKPLVERLDPPLPRKGRSIGDDYIGYRRIKPDWYLYYESN